MEHKVTELRARIRAGTYPTSDHLEAVADTLTWLLRRQCGRFLSGAPAGQ
jgi:hypothetical protein